MRQNLNWGLLIFLELMFDEKMNMENISGYYKLQDKHQIEYESVHVYLLLNYREAVPTVLVSGTAALLPTRSMQTRFTIISILHTHVM